MTSPPIRVLYVTDAPVVGGAERSLANLLGHLSDSVTAVVMGTHEDVVEKIAAARAGTAGITVAPVRGKGDLLRFIRLRRAITALGPDVVHVSVTGPRSCRFALAAALVPRRLKVVAVEQLPSAPTTPWQRTWRRWVHHRLARHIAVGQRSARELEGWLGLRPGAVGTIYNGVPEPAEADPRPASRPVVGTVCRLDHQKGLDVLLEAVAPLDVDLRIVGDGPLRKELEERSIVLGVGDRVSMAGWVEDPSTELAGFDVFALASRSEGFPLSIVEAMLMGIPVVATDVGSVREAVVPDLTGLVVPPGDAAALRAAIATLVADRDRRAQLGSAGRERARASFTATAMAAEFEAIYRSVVTA